MKIVICVKQVPDTTQVEIDPETGTLVREGVPSILNPLDAFAVEEALRLRERLGAGEVIALTMGPPQAEYMLREVLAYGVDQAVMLTGREFAGSDTWATSYALARGIERIGGVGLVLAGKQAIDGDTAQVGPEIAVHLGWPQVTFARRIREISPEAAVVERLGDHGSQLLNVKLPVVVTVLKDINEPRLPNLKDLRRGRFAEIPRWSGNDVNADATRLGLSGSPTRVVRIFHPGVGRTCSRYEGEAVEAGIAETMESLGREGLL